jgi:hypothetical protein
MTRVKPALIMKLLNWPLWQYRGPLWHRQGSRGRHLEKSTTASSILETKLEQELEAKVGRRIAKTLEKVKE